MPKLYDEETNLRIDAEDEFGAQPREYDVPFRETDPSYEETQSREESFGKSEYNENVNTNIPEETPEEADRRRHNRLKDLVLRPAVAVTMVATLTLAGFGIDFLGYDYLNSGLTTMKSEWLEHHEDQWGEPHEHWDEHWDEQWKDEWDEPYSEQRDEPGDDAFPSLGNPDPDFYGEYSWSEYGPEFYLRFYYGQTCYYLRKGYAWNIYDTEGKEVGSLDGATYDLGTNTLTLENFSCDVIDANLLGNGFKIKLIGQSEVGAITIWGAGYGGSLTFEGDGSLRVTQGGITLNAEGSDSCCLVKSGVTLELFGDEGASALNVIGTTMSEAVYLANGMKMLNSDGNPCAVATFSENGYYDHTVYSGSGENASFILISGS